MSRWECEEVLDAAQKRLDQNPDMMRIRRTTVEHLFGTLKGWMGSTHFLTKTLDRVSGSTPVIMEPRVGPQFGNT
jgi:hypothetical protein